jgi:hypothetical protein
MMKPTCSFRPQTADVVRQERRFAQLPFKSLLDLMCCRDVFGLVLFVVVVVGKFRDFVHKCMKIAGAAAVAAARQQPRWLKS